MSEKTPDEELVNILKSKLDPAVKVCALDFILGLTGSAEGTAHILENKDYIQTVCGLISADQNFHVLEKTFKCLVNLTADEEYVEKVTNSCPSFVGDLVNHAMEDKQCVQLALMVLANVTRLETTCQQTLTQMDKIGGTQKLVELLNRQNSAELYHFSAMVLSNLSRGSLFQKELMDNDLALFKKILPFTTYPESGIRRLGIVGTIKNCCFDTEYHGSLLSDDCNLLPALCLPLAGPEEFDEDEMEKLPLELQYLGETQKRDSDPYVRKMCIQALNQLCATKHGRTVLRDKGIYYILRELHKCEEDRSVTVACENVVDILISDEPAPEHSNLKEVEISPELAKKFDDMNIELLKDD